MPGGADESGAGEVRYISSDETLAPEAMDAVDDLMRESFKELTKWLIWIAVQDGTLPWNDKMPESWKPEEAASA